MRVQYCYDVQYMDFWALEPLHGRFMFIHAQTILRQANFFDAATFTWCSLAKSSYCTEQSSWKTWSICNFRLWICKILWIKLKNWKFYPDFLLYKFSRSWWRLANFSQLNFFFSRICECVIVFSTNLYIQLNKSCLFRIHTIVLW